MVQLKSNNGESLPPDVPAQEIATTMRPSASQVTIEVVCSVSGVAELRTEFQHLQAVTGNTLPFSCYEWQHTWCQYFLHQDRAISDSPMFYVARDAGGACVGILPLISTTRRLGGLNVASISLLGSDPGITEIRIPLIHPGYEESVAVAVNTRLQADKTWDWIQWISTSGDFAATMGKFRALSWQPLAPTYMLDLPASWEKFASGLKRNIRESLRHCYNSLKRAGHQFEFRVATTRSEVRPALDRLFELHVMRADMQGSVTHPNRFASPLVRDFIYAVCEEFASSGILRIFQVAIGGKVVASRIGFVVGDCLYLYYSGFDPAWSRFSVMTTTVAEAIKYAIRTGLKTVNLSPGTDVSKTRWGPYEVIHQTAYEHSGRLRSRLVRHAYLKAKSGGGLQGWLLQRLVPGRRTWN